MLQKMIKVSGSSWLILLLKVLDQPASWPPPVSCGPVELARARVVRLEVEHVKRMTAAIREEVDSVELCLFCHPEASPSHDILQIAII